MPDPRDYRREGGTSGPTGFTLTGRNRLRSWRHLVRNSAHPHRTNVDHPISWKAPTTKNSRCLSLTAIESCFFSQHFQDRNRQLPRRRGRGRPRRRGRGRLLQSCGSDSQVRTFKRVCAFSSHRYQFGYHRVFWIDFKAAKRGYDQIVDLSSRIGSKSLVDTWVWREMRSKRHDACVVAASAKSGSSTPDGGGNAPSWLVQVHLATVIVTTGEQSGAQHSASPIGSGQPCLP